VQLDDREPMPAQGTAFWSLALDVNGAESRAQSVKFNVDKKAPLTRVTSHQSGVLVSGQVTLEGTVEDANGMASLAMSRDGGKTYTPVAMSLDKPARQGTFKVGLDTRKTPDGPQVLWFRAADKMGLVGRYTFLVFINNDAPVLEVLFPADDAPVNGKVLVCGRASDKIGLKSLSYDLGAGDSGKVELVPGNPFWTQEIDLAGKRTGSLQITYTLVNLTGNTQTRNRTGRSSPSPRRSATPVSGGPRPCPCTGSYATRTLWTTWNTPWMEANGRRFPAARRSASASE